MSQTNNSRINKIETLISPNKLIQSLPAPSADTIAKYRNNIKNILNKKDNRLLVIIGPCSIHEPKSALDYANKLTEIAKRTQDTLLIVMRTYFEKPRTSLGWKGYINDPHLDNSCDINLGLERARQLLIEINNIGMPVATEFLDTITPQYIADLISWGAIGARTAESQTHRNLASGLSMPIGIKNSTTGHTHVAIDAITAAREPHSFLGIDSNGSASIVHTNGNPDTHIILRGGNITGPNYSETHVINTLDQLSTHDLPTNIMIDCSHGNSQKDHTQQVSVLNNIMKQIIEKHSPIIGVMLESFLKSGKQSLEDPSKLEYGKSITDACIDWGSTEQCLYELSRTIRSNH